MKTTNKVLTAVQTLLHMEVFDCGIKTDLLEELVESMTEA